MGNPFGRSTTVPLTNKSGASVANGDFVYVGDGSNADAFTTGTTANRTSAVGIAQQTIANGAVGLVTIGGYVSLVNVNASVTLNHFGASYSVAKQATDVGATRASGTCLFYLTAGATPDAILWQPDLGGASLTNPMTTKGDVIIGDTSGVPSRLAAGATAGMVLTSAGSGAFETFSLPPGYEFTYTETTSITTITVVAEASSVSIVSAGAITYDGSTAVYIEWFLPEVFGPSTANADVTLTLWEDSTDLGQIAVVRSETANRGVTSIHGRRKRTPSNASHNYTIKGFAGTTTGGAGGGAGGAGNLVPGYCRVVKA